MAQSAWVAQTTALSESYGDASRIDKSREYRAPHRTSSSRRCTLPRSRSVAGTRDSAPRACCRATGCTTSSDAPRSANQQGIPGSAKMLLVFYALAALRAVKTAPASFAVEQTFLSSCHIATALLAINSAKALVAAALFANRPIARDAIVWTAVAAVLALAARATAPLVVPDAKPALALATR